MPDAPTTVEAHLRRLDEERLVALVADLWAARGYETTTDSGVVTASRAGRSLTVVPVARSRRDSLPGFDRSRSRSRSLDGADVVVAPAGTAGLSVPSDARVLDATDLREMLWYAVDGETRTRLCTRHLGGAPETLDVPSPTPSAVERLRAVQVPVPSVSTVALAVFLVVGLGASAGLVFTDGPSGAGTVPSEATPAAVPTVTATTEADPMPPGVTDGGIANLTALATAHERILAGRSYSLWIDRYRRRSPNGTLVQRDIDVTVSGDRYLVVVTLVEGTDLVPVQTVYYDGENWTAATPRSGRSRFRRIPATGSSPVQGPGPFELRRSLVRRYLSTPETRLTGRVTEGGRRLYRIEGSGQPTGMTREFRSYNVTALVDLRGLVHSVSVTYTLAEGTQASGQFEVTYGQFGNVTVTQPPWDDRGVGENATATPGDRSSATQTADSTTETQSADADTASPSSTAVSSPPSTAVSSPLRAGARP